MPLVFSSVLTGLSLPLNCSSKQDAICFMELVYGMDSFRLAVKSQRDASKLSRPACLSKARSRSTP